MAENLPQRFEAARIPGTVAAPQRAHYRYRLVFTKRCILPGSSYQAATHKSTSLSHRQLLILQMAGIGLKLYLAPRARS